MQITDTLDTLFATRRAEAQSAVNTWVELKEVFQAQYNEDPNAENRYCLMQCIMYHEMCKAMVEVLNETGVLRKY